MLDFKTLQSNPLVSYSILKPNSITNPINLTEKEIQIFNVFKEIIEEKNLKNIELRVVGGWVRDHLLNIPSNDIDISIKGLDTNTFARFINEKVNKGDKNKYAIVNTTIKKANKNNIELTKTKINDLMIDLVELKQNALEDAKRRDFTFNALFYNILENKIEDLLESGINDLKNGFIRECISNYHDNNYDSLRILRMIRFAAKYQFIIDDTYLSYIVNNKKFLQNGLLTSVSKEITHKEIYSIFSGPNPSFAIYALYKLNLLKEILHLDEEYKDSKEAIFSEKDILNCVNIFIIGKKVFDKYKSYFEGENYNDSYKCSFYSLLLTLHMKNFNDKNYNNLAKIVLAKVLKLETKTSLKIINHFDEFNNFISKNEYKKLNVGILIRTILASNISIMIIISTANEYVNKINPTDVLDKIDEDLIDNIFQKYYEFYKYMKKEKMENVCQIKSIIDGKKIKEIFKIPDKYIGELLTTLINKQIETSNNLTEEDAKNVLKSRIEELKIEY